MFEDGSGLVPLSEDEFEVAAEGDESFRQEGGPWFNAYFAFLERRKRWVVAFWAMVLGLSCWFGPEFLKMGNDNQDAPPGTRAYDDQQVFTDRFLSKAQELPILVLLSCKVECDLTAEPEVEVIQNFSNTLLARVSEYNATHHNVLASMGYYQFRHTPLDAVKDPFMGRDKNITFFTISESSLLPTSERYAFVRWLNNELDVLNPAPERYRFGSTGFDSMAMESVDSTAEQIKQVDSFTVPLAMALLAYMVRSWRLLLIAFINMGVSIMGGFAAMVFMIKCLGMPHPESASAQLMEVMALSLSIDYSLFITRRLRDEVKHGATPTKAIYRSLLHAGHVVAMSGLTILAVFMGFLFMPARVVKMDGTSCAVGVFCAIVVALSNTPALVLCLPNFFTTFDGCCGYPREKEKVSPTIGNHLEDGAANGIRSPLMEQGDHVLVAGVQDQHATSSLLGGEGGGAVPVLNATGSDRAVHPMYTGWRFKATSLITRWPYNVLTLFLLYVLILPLGLQVKRLNVSQDILAGIPRHSAAGDTFRLMISGDKPEFPGGSFSPFYILAAMPKGKSVMNNHMWGKLQSLAEKVYKDTECSSDKNSVSNPAFAGGIKISLLEAEALLATADSAPCRYWKWLANHVCGPAMAYKFAFDMSVNPERDAVLTTVLVPFFPFAQKSSAFIDELYGIMATLEDDPAKVAEKHRVTLHLCGFEVGFDAIMRHVYHLFPFLVCTTLFIIFVMLSVMLKSAFVPIRLLLTIMLPLAAVFGLAVLVYQDGILSGISESLDPVGSFFWYLPILTVSMVLGLAIDYDLFLFVRVQEHRHNGYDLRASIVKASCEAGGTISAAGIIMTACFGGMLLSSQSTINESGWLLSTAIIFSTFIVNTLALPAVLSLNDRVVWWPRKMPQRGLLSLDSPEFTGSPQQTKPVASTRTASDSSETADEDTLHQRLH